MDTLFHTVSIIIHVFCGILALLIGFTLLVKKKGTLFHKKAGLWFAVLMVFIFITGVAGVIIFKRNMFLLVITVLAGYNTYSGIRIVRIKSNVRYWKDIFAMIAAVITTVYFLFYLHSIGFYWDPVIIYSTVGYLFLVILYDISRYFIPKSRYGNLWIYEHSCKMISALSGLLSAFIGTILPHYKPYSQIMPSLLMTLVMIFFVIKLFTMHRQKDPSKNEIFQK
ncbi:DUF2306 domain-containing protein [Chryseobacterium polytrichastri]|uniref:DUF2306 domain-containing protein n=1 Tax=Chryseobacterium polytrichastri TaxID=1302687 RepID=A0A1M6S358_9FLAO|nr:hypothetical protein [Chryseobacterium polytrichastri]SHK39262.1 hypothetical protein SAMN05444267_1003154 [Chryseobacterium polytrichastri]